MTRTGVETRELVAKAAAAAVAYYDHPVAQLGETWALDLRIAAEKARHAQWTTAQRLVNEALAEGCSHRQIAVAAHLPGAQIIKFISDPQERADAYAAEIHHLERALDGVREARTAEARGRHAEGELKTALAQSFGVTRPTLDKWLAPDGEKVS